VAKLGLLCFSLLIGLSNGGLFGQDFPVEPSGSPLPRGAVAVEFKVIFAIEKDPVPQVAQPWANSGADGAGSKTEMAIPAREGELIESAAEYESIFKQPSRDIDWETQRIYVAEEQTVYRLSRLESTSSLSGVYRTTDALYIGQTTTFVGPCQGIAQLREWFSYRHRYLFLLIPRMPQRIVRFSTSIGGCPPNIP
jgi:hypothetical protein